MPARPALADHDRASQALDRLRSEATLRTKLPLLVKPDPEPGSPTSSPTTSLRLVFAEGLAAVDAMA